MHVIYFFFFNDTATTEIYTLSLHDALPISLHHPSFVFAFLAYAKAFPDSPRAAEAAKQAKTYGDWLRSEEHTSELQSRQYLVCRLLLEKKTQLITPHLHISYLIHGTYSLSS